MFLYRIKKVNLFSLRRVGKILPCGFTVPWQSQRQCLYCSKTGAKRDKKNYHVTTQRGLLRTCIHSAGDKHLLYSYITIKTHDKLIKLIKLINFKNSLIKLIKTHDKLICQRTGELSLMCVKNCNMTSLVKKN